MMTFKIISLPIKFVRKYSIKVKPVVVPDENVLNNIHNNVFKPRKHPGITDHKTVTLPDKFVKAVVSATEDYPVKTLIMNSKTLSRHLKGKVAPMETDELKRRTNEIQAKVLDKYKDVVINTEEDKRRFKQMIENKVNSILRKKIYHWKPMKYDVYNSLLYLMARSPAEYAVLVKIFGDISSRDPSFKPKSLFDFGSGIGTGTWAAQMYWQKYIFEYYNVDSSREMNDLAQILLQGGKGTGNLPKGIFYRQFVPASKVTYDLVVCAYSLLELPSLESRFQTLIDLWNKTEQYLVIVEQGTNAGFKVVTEVRDFLLQLENESNSGHVFSPCPHDDACPRFLLDDGTPCSFEVTYYTMPVGQISETRKELYSYVVLRKGKRSENDLKWPRIIRPTLVRSKHSICRLCTAKGNLSEVIFTASRHGKVTYHCARASKWGDLLPLKLDFQKLDNETSVDEESSQEKTNCGNNNVDEINTCAENINNGIDTLSNRNCVDTSKDYT